MPNRHQPSHHSQPTAFRPTTRCTLPFPESLPMLRALCAISSLAGSPRQDWRFGVALCGARRLQPHSSQRRFPCPSCSAKLAAKTSARLVKEPGRCGSVQFLQWGSSHDLGKHLHFHQVSTNRVFVLKEDGSVEFFQVISWATSARSLRTSIPDTRSSPKPRRNR